MNRFLLIFTICLLFCVSVYSQEVQKVDEFGLIGCDDYLARMDNVVITAQNNPSSSIYILIYEGKEYKYNKRRKNTELVNPTVGTAEAKISSIKKYFSIRNFSVSRFTFVKAGFRENLMVEIWLVPNGAMPPKSTPTIEKLKYRKGKAIGFCTDCCEI